MSAVREFGSVPVLRQSAGMSYLRHLSVYRETVQKCIGIEWQAVDVNGNA